MKLLIAIFGNQDAPAVLTNLTKNNFRLTRLSTTGEFLKTGNTTILLGVEDEKVQAAIDIIEQFSSERVAQEAPFSTPLGENSLLAKPMQVTVGGAVVFQLDIEQFYKL